LKITANSNPGKHVFLHFCVETEAFLVNKMFKTQPKYLELPNQVLFRKV